MSQNIVTFNRIEIRDNTCLAYLDTYSHNSSGLPIVSESFCLKNVRFLDAIHFDFKASYLTLLYNSLSILSLDFF